MRRRQFIAFGSTISIAAPLMAYAQQREQIRRVALLLPAEADDAQFQDYIGAFLQAMALLGWNIGHNLRISTRWATADAAKIRANAGELVALAPDVILAHGSSIVGPLLQATRTIPVVFPVATDPVGAGFVESLARPGGNATGFIAFEYSISGKWLELLKQIVPSITRVAVFRDATQGAGNSEFAAIQTVAQSLRVEVIPINMRDAGQIEEAVSNFGRSQKAGMIVTSGGAAIIHRDLLIKLAARHKLPAIYPYRFFIGAGGLISYGPDQVDQYRQAAGYVDRILKGEKPTNLPVQTPRKYETVLNLKTAKVLGLDVPPSVLARSDEIIE